MDSFSASCPEVAFVVLAAGAGSRFGGGKLDAMLGGRPLGRWATDAVEAAGATNRFIVTRDSEPFFSQNLAGWHRIVNADADAGIHSSIRCAAEAADPFARIVLALADMPFIPPDHLRALGSGTGPMFTLYPSGARGIPAAFPQGWYASLATLPAGKGASALSDGSHAAIALDREMLFDFDTMADFDNAGTLHPRLRRKGRALDGGGGFAEQGKIG